MPIITSFGIAYFIWCPLRRNDVFAKQKMILRVNSQTMLYPTETNAKGTRTYDNDGQKYSRSARFSLRVSPYFFPFRPPCFRHRRRSGSMQLTASAVSGYHRLDFYVKRQNKKHTAWCAFCFGSPCRARTNDPAVNSRMLYRLS